MYILKIFKKILDMVSFYRKIILEILEYYKIIEIKQILLYVLNLIDL